MTRVAAVLGAGIQGVCSALALARAGWKVKIFEAAEDCLLRASFRNEGKLHLGFTYAADTSFRTAELMLDSAMYFRAFFDEMLPGVIPFPRLISGAFTYLVMRDGLLSRDQVAEHFERVETGIAARSAHGASYLGIKAAQSWREAAIPRHVNPEAVAGCFETSERALDLDGFRAALSTALPAIPGLELHYGHRVHEVARAPTGFIVRGLANGVEWTSASDIVVNCLWDQRLPFDAAMGVPLPECWTHRLKYRVLAELPTSLAGLPALTMLLGPYGDIVPMGRRSYISWYPVCRQGWSTDLTPPKAWSDACAGKIAPETLDQLPRQVIAALSRIVPQMSEAHVTDVDAGIVFSRGDTDIDQPDSAFHERSRVGITSADGYFSIDTGKFVCAPLFARRLVHSV